MIVFESDRPGKLIGDAMITALLHDTWGTLGLGLTIKIVANPTKKMIEDYSRYAGTLPYIDGIIGSGEDVGAFKPSPKVFRRN